MWRASILISLAFLMLLAYLARRRRTLWVRAYKQHGKWYMTTIPTCELCHRRTTKPHTFVVCPAERVPFSGVPAGHAFWARLFEDSMHHQPPWATFFYVDDAQIVYRKGVIYLCRRCAKWAARAAVCDVISGEAIPHGDKLTFQIRWDA